MFLQVHKYFFCSKTNRRSLLWVEFGICIGRESSNVLTKICLFNYKKVCSIESGLRQKGHLSSEANLYFSSSFFVVIILCTTSKVNGTKLIIFRGLVYIHKTITPIRKFWKAFFRSPYCGGFWNKFLDEQTVIIFTAEFG